MTSSVSSFERIRHKATLAKAEHYVLAIGRMLVRGGFSDEELDEFLDLALSGDYPRCLLVCHDYLMRLRQRREI